MKAWIIRWNGLDTDDRLREQPVVAILSARTRAEDVRRHVQFLYTVTHSTLSEQLDQARYNRPADVPYPAEFAIIGGVRFENRITCGHNPFLEAMLVTDLAVSENSDGTEMLKWNLPAMDCPRGTRSKS
ncbi:hypothetical protein LAZ40_05640 [Cereibacter sphaeroides]|uniref:hypothetical protein n=1 Tax=Cereibacter sphaeroides TaxID=1063 RepID=UPI001F238531|nr:hypothetical protein [Cereibacter sphaeroides]MCE6958532.1 hypothetical protein [Cereibacter sphaeroides]MCE6972805.1 hypothetical protein [Cereibacter sphaeroides]